MTGLEPFNPLAVALIALLNPVVVLTAFFLGRNADQPQKIVVAGFAAALAGSIAVWIVTWLDLLPAKGIGGEGGVFVLQFLLGTFWAWVAYRLSQHPTPPPG